MSIKSLSLNLSVCLVCASFAFALPWPVPMPMPARYAKKHPSKEPLKISYYQTLERSSSPQIHPQKSCDGEYVFVPLNLYDGKFQKITSHYPFADHFWAFPDARSLNKDGDIGFWGTKYIADRVELAPKKWRRIESLASQKQIHINYIDHVIINAFLSAPVIEVHGGETLKWVYEIDQEYLKKMCRVLGASWKRAKKGSYRVFVPDTQSAHFSASQSISLGNIDMPNADVILSFDDSAHGHANKQETSDTGQKAYTVNVSNVSMRSLKIAVPRGAQIIARGFDVHVDGRRYTKVTDFIEYVS